MHAISPSGQCHVLRGALDPVGSVRDPSDIPHCGPIPARGGGSRRRWPSCPPARPSHPRPLRQHRGGEGLLPRVLLVVQHPAPARRPPYRTIEGPSTNSCTTTFSTSISSLSTPRTSPPVTSRIRNGRNLGGASCESPGRYPLVSQPRAASAPIWRIGGHVLLGDLRDPGREGRGRQRRSSSVPRRRAPAVPRSVGRARPASARSCYGAVQQTPGDLGDLANCPVATMTSPTASIGFHGSPGGVRDMKS